MANHTALNLGKIMKKTTYTFSLDWENHGIVCFVNDDKLMLEQEVNAYLRADDDFARFLRALGSSVREESDECDPDDLAFIDVVSNKSHQFTLEDLDRINELDIDYLKHSVGRIVGWESQEHVSEVPANANIVMPGGKNQFKRVAKRMVAVLKQSGLDVTNAQAMDILAKTLYSKPYGEILKTLL